MTRKPSNLDRPANELRHERATITHAITSGAVRPEVAAGMRVRADRIDAELTRRSLLDEVLDCTCVEFCDEDPKTACSLSGIPHVHPASDHPSYGPCPVHPGRPGDH